jgi:gliding motility-associated-like protein
MKMKRKISFIVVLVLGIASVSRSQSIPNQVINSAGGGGSVGTTGVEVYYNIGETVIATTVGGSSIVTQGFLQPDIIGKFGLTASPAYNGVSCFGKTDGFIAITASVSGVAPQVQSQISYMYYWEPSSVCPTNDCATISGLNPGTYSVLIVSNNGTLSIPSDSAMVQNIVITDNSEPCLLEIFNGVTPNGDGQNDFFFIGNIDQYQDNVVDIYNRWGQQLAHIPGYNNVDKKWTGTINDTQVIAPSGTYFFVISLGAKNSKPIKGWLELIHK